MKVQTARCRKVLFTPLAVTLFGLGACASVSPRDADGPLVTTPRFNQRLIEYSWNPTGRAARLLPSDLRAANTHVDLDVEDPASVVAFVLEQCPPHSVVYPTEHYYYFEFLAGTRRIAGNLRFTDAARGVLHTGYFDRYDSTFLKAANFDAESGLLIDWNPEQRTSRVRFRGFKREFLLPHPRASVPGLLADESLVTNVLDESGFAFHLIFHRSSAQFYYVLDEHAPLPDRIVRVAEDVPVWLGVRSRFMFLSEPALGRRVLVGVYAPSVRANDYYDGPFDQVPPDLQVRDKLEAAYPYVKLRGGIDEHGNFNQIDGQRVAISPYQDYTSIFHMLDLIAEGFDPNLPSPASFASLVYEAKRDTHKRLGALSDPDTLPVPPHERALSSTWPVDHWAQVSETWPHAHTRSHSLKAPANQPID